MKSIQSLLPAALAVMLCACAAPIQRQVSREVPREFIERSIKELMQQNLAVDIPIQLKIPIEFTPYSPSPEKTVWAPSSDLRLIQSGRESERRDGYLVTQVSSNFGFDQKTSLFSDFRGNTELNLATQLEAMGFRDVSVRRSTVGGYPVMAVQSTLIGGRISFVLYVATLIDTNAVFIYYSPPEYCKLADEVIWNNIVMSVVGLPYLGQKANPAFRCPGSSENRIRMPSGTPQQMCLSMTDAIYRVVRFRDIKPAADKDVWAKFADIVGNYHEMDTREALRIFENAYSYPKLNELSIAAYEIAVRCKHQTNARPIPPLSQYAGQFEQCQSASDKRLQNDCYEKATRLK